MPAFEWLLLIILDAGDVALAVACLAQSDKLATLQAGNYVTLASQAVRSALKPIPADWLSCENAGVELLLELDYP